MMFKWSLTFRTLIGLLPSPGVPGDGADLPPHSGQQHEGPHHSQRPESTCPGLC